MKVRHRDGRIGKAVSVRKGRLVEVDFGDGALTFCLSTSLTPLPDEEKG